MESTENNTMANFAAGLVAVIAAVYLLAIIGGLIASFPFGLPVMLVLGCFLFLFFGVLKQRAENKEDDYYSKNVNQ